MRRRTVLWFSAALLSLTLVRAVPGAAAERHPEIHKAIHALEVAKGHLEHAAHDFGGHRADALHAVDDAIHQLKFALEYDK
jgi:hypothetical protein